MEYTQLINESASILFPNMVDADEVDEFPTLSMSTDNEEDLMEHISMIEDDVLLLLAFEASNSRKRPPTEDLVPIRSKKRQKYTSRQLYRTNPFSNERERFSFKYSLWYNNYMLHPQLESRVWQNQFRNRFRTTYEGYESLLEDSKNSDLMEKWNKGDGVKVHAYNKKTTVPLGLLVLCALRYLGRGWTLDDLVENTGIGFETVRKFIHGFLIFGSRYLYNKYVVMPENSTDLNSSSSEYKAAGYPGCVGSTDASHIVTERCSYRLRQLHLGYKLAHTARTYNITVNRRKILSTTHGHPARFNDKTLILFDTFINKMRKGDYNDLHTFELYAFNDEGEIILETYKGCYVIVDNGYLPWSVTIPPMKRSSLRTEIRFSEWLESLRKDVECVFGILKSR